MLRGKRWEGKSNTQIIMNFKLSYFPSAITDLIRYRKWHIELMLISLLSKL